MPDDNDLPEGFPGAPAGAPTAASPAGPAGAAPQIDARREPRIAVSWRSMVRSPAGRNSEARVRDISENGIGLVTADAVPSHTVLDIAILVPDLIDGTRSVTVRGKVRAAYVVIHGAEYRVGCQWNELDAASRELLKQHIKRHRYAGG